MTQRWKAFALVLSEELRRAHEKIALCATEEHIPASDMRHELGTDFNLVHCFHCKKLRGYNLEDDNIDYIYKCSHYGCVYGVCNICVRSMDPPVCASCCTWVCADHDDGDASEHIVNARYYCCSCAFDARRAPIPDPTYADGNSEEE
jgi:hypothetical protein